MSATNAPPGFPLEVHDLLTGGTPATPAIVRGAVVGVDSPKWPGRWKVDRINPRTLSLIREGDGMRLKCDRMFVIAPPEAADAPAAEDLMVRINGTVVEVADRRYPGLFVITNGQHTPEYVKCARLGAGEADPTAPGRWFKFPPRMLTRVPLADLPAKLAALNLI